jgi:hypothetical protein
MTLRWRGRHPTHWERGGHGARQPVMLAARQRPARPQADEELGHACLRLVRLNGVGARRARVTPPLA